MRQSTAGRKAVAIATVAVLGLVVAALCGMALTRAQSPVAAGTPEPLAALTETPSPSPTPTPPPASAPAQIDRAEERFLSFAGGSAWRATAGSCTGTAPLLQRMNEQGDWVDTPLGDDAPHQIASLDAYTDGAEFVGGVDDTCSTASLRTFSAGAAWESYPDALARSRFIDLIDPSTVHTREGDIAAPCAEATGLRAWGDIVALVCDERAWRQTEATWTALDLTNVKVLAIDDTEIIVGNETADCVGLTLARVSDTASSMIGCADGVDLAGPIAIAATESGVVVWAADSMIEVAG